MREFVLAALWIAVILTGAAFCGVIFTAIFLSVIVSPSWSALVFADVPIAVLLFGLESAILREMERE